MSRFLQFINESIETNFEYLFDNTLFEKSQQGMLQIIDFLTLIYQQASGNVVNLNKIKFPEYIIGIDPTTKHFYVQIGKSIFYSLSDIKNMGLTGDRANTISKLLRYGPSLNIKGSLKINVILTEIKKTSYNDVFYFSGNMQGKNILIETTKDAATPQLVLQHITEMNGSSIKTLQQSSEKSIHSNNKVMFIETNSMNNINTIKNQGNMHSQINKLIQIYRSISPNFYRIASNTHLLIAIKKYIDYRPQAINWSNNDFLENFNEFVKKNLIKQTKKREDAQFNAVILAHNLSLYQKDIKMFLDFFKIVKGMKEEISAILKEIAKISINTGSIYHFKKYCVVEKNNSIFFIKTVNLTLGTIDFK